MTDFTFVLSCPCCPPAELPSQGCLVDAASCDIAEAGEATDGKPWLWLQYLPRDETTQEPQP